MARVHCWKEARGTEEVGYQSVMIGTWEYSQLRSLSLEVEAVRAFPFFLGCHRDGGLNDLSRLHGWVSCAGPEV